MSYKKTAEPNQDISQKGAREKFLALSLESTRKSYYPQLQKNLERSKENEKRLQLLIDNMPAQISYVNSEERYVLVNREFEKAAGFTREEIIGKRMETILGKKNYSKVKGHIKKALSGQSGHFEFSTKQYSGSTRWYEISYVAQTDSKGNVNGFYAMTLDLTEKKHAEQERISLKDRLRQAQKMEAIGTLSGGIAHDFNNILSGIFGYTELADSHINNPTQARTYLKKIFKSAKRASALIEQILTFSRQTDYVRKPIPFSIVYKEVMALLRSSLPANIEIKEELNSKAAILADATQIHQVIMNLCTNAYHAMAADGGLLTVSLDEMHLNKDQLPGEPALAPGKYIRLSIKDTGPGIDPSIREKIFDPYFTTKKIGKGTGLGLAIVNGIVKKHHGFIRFESKTGLGTCFNIYFPVFDETHSEKDGSGLKGKPDLSGSERIMLVDDETAILETLSMLLSRKGYNVSTFENGQAALEAFSSNPDGFDLIVTDMTMPKMTGDKLSREILKIRGDIPIVICTGFHENLSEQEAVKSGIKKYIQKPVLGKDLSGIIRELLDGQ